MGPPRFRIPGALGLDERGGSGRSGAMNVVTANVPVSDGPRIDSPSLCRQLFSAPNHRVVKTIKSRADDNLRFTTFTCGEGAYAVPRIPAIPLRMTDWLRNRHGFGSCDR